jgi:hypothetical protein
MITGVCIGSLFFDLSGGKSSNVYTERLSVLFIMIVFVFYRQMKLVAHHFDDRPNFYRETADKLYGS